MRERKRSVVIAPVARYHAMERLGRKILRAASFGDFYQETFEYGFSATEVREGDAFVG